MTLIRDGKVVTNDFATVVGQDDLPASGAIIVSLEQWQANHDALASRNDPLGIQLAAGEAPEAIKDELGAFALIALEFPAFSDGRAFSYARLLRERYGYEGELRAVGDVELEQLHFMHRSGFNAFEFESEHAEQDFEIAQSDLSVYYQPTGDARETATQKRIR